MQVIPAIDLQGGRSRVVFWPGVATGVGAPTDRPDRIAEHFVEVLMAPGYDDATGTGTPDGDALINALAP